MRTRAWIVSAVGVATLLTVVLAAAHWLDPLPEGLAARYFFDVARTGAPIRSLIEASPSTDRLKAAWRGETPNAFGAAWDGAFLILTEATYTFATVSDDGSHVFVDGQLVVDNGGGHGVQQRVGSVHLTRGVHAISVDFFQEGGVFRLDLLWARGTGSLATMSSEVLAPRRVTRDRFLVSLALRRALAYAEWLWVGTLTLAAGGALARGFAAMRAALARDRGGSALKWIVAASLSLNVLGLWWGLPALWVPDEMRPMDVLDALSQHFSRGWFDRYPPFHYYVLAVLYSPMLLLRALGRVDLSAPAMLAGLVVAGRLLTVAAGAGIVTSAYLCGARAFGKRSGLFAAAIVGLVTPFVYYAKTANVDVPYLFWFALSLVAYLRLLDTLELRDFVLFAVTATLAVCTKDQAYGLYLLMPLVMVDRIWRADRDAGLWRAILDRRLAIATGTAAVLFALCHNLLFNTDGFLNHVKFLTGGGSQNYRMFEPTLAGRWALLQLTARLIQLSVGWPMLVPIVAGLGAAFVRTASRRAAFVLVLPLLSYYVGFVNVILYNYDRFVMPMCFILALFGGFAFDRWLGSRVPWRSWRGAAVAGVFAYTVLYAGTVDVLMIRDSRYTVKRWLADHARPGDVVATVFELQYLPGMEGLRHVDVGTIDALGRERPALYVLNTDYARAVRPEDPLGRLIAGLQQGTLGYHLASRFRGPAPWPWLPWGHRDLVGARLEMPVVSTLRDINPTIEVFERDAPR